MKKGIFLWVKVSESICMKDYTINRGVKYEKQKSNCTEKVSR